MRYKKGGFETRPFKWWMALRLFTPPLDSRFRGSDGGKMFAFSRRSWLSFFPHALLVTALRYKTQTPPKIVYSWLRGGQGFRRR